MLSFVSDVLFHTLGKNSDGVNQIITLYWWFVFVFSGGIF